MAIGNLLTVFQEALGTINRPMRNQNKEKKYYAEADLNYVKQSGSN